MKYEKIVEGKFIERPNCFVALADIGNEHVKVHVKNTGRCKELLVPGATIYLEDYEINMRSRTLRYSLIGVEKYSSNKMIMINMDSQAPNKVVKESLLSGKIKLPNMGELSEVKAEAKYGDSRLDFFVKDKEGGEAYIEVKGVTLERNGEAFFPDAPTERGIKHLYELARCIEENKHAFVIFVIQMKGIKVFKPNDETHKAFGDALREVSQKGVIPLAYDCIVGRDYLSIDEEIKIEL